MNRILLCLVVLGGAIVNWSFAAEPRDPAADEAAIRKADEAYVTAFNNHDAKALADAWSPEAVYLNRVSGAEVVGRAAIAEQFTAALQRSAGDQARPQRAVDPVRLAECGSRAGNRQNALAESRAGGGRV